MLAPNYNELYAIPQEIVYPTTPDGLRLDTEYANLNSDDFKIRDAKRCDLPEFFDCIDRNQDHNIIIAANDVSIVCL